MPMPKMKRHAMPMHKRSNRFLTVQIAKIKLLIDLAIP